jgi:hypothetical protein
MTSLWLIIGLIISFSAALKGVLFVSIDFIETRTKKDLWLGDLAEAITKRELQVNALNLKLETLHHSCPAILALPPATSQSALKVGRALSQKLSAAQSTLRSVNKFSIYQAQQKGYSVRDTLSKRRLHNPCKFRGPLKNKKKSSLRVFDHNSGIHINTTRSIEWHFRHPRSKQPWF